MSTAYLPVESPFALLPRMATFLDEVDQEAAAIRQAEIDAAQAVAVYRRIEESNSIGCQAGDDLESWSIDDLRCLACELRVPERSKITEKAELLAEIRRRI